MTIGIPCPAPKQASGMESDGPVEKPLSPRVIRAGSEGKFMLQIIIATCRPDAMRSFTKALSSDPEVHFVGLASGAEVLNAVRTSPPHLVVVDSTLPDEGPLALVSKLLQVNAMVNTAVVSPLSEDEFHEATEGLGILGRIPECPGSGDAAELIRKLKQVLGMSM